MLDPHRLAAVQAEIQVDVDQLEQKLGVNGPSRLRDVTLEIWPKRPPPGALEAIDDIVAVRAGVAAEKSGMSH